MEATKSNFDYIRTKSGDEYLCDLDTEECVDLSNSPFSRNE